MLPLYNRHRSNIRAMKGTYIKMAIKENMGFASVMEFGTNLAHATVCIILCSHKIVDSLVIVMLRCKESSHINTDMSSVNFMYFLIDRILISIRPILLYSSAVFFHISAAVWIF